MYVFGVDIPLVELFLFFVLIMIVLIILMVILIRRIRDLNARLDVLMKEEEKELAEVEKLLDREEKDINKLEKAEKKLEGLSEQECEAKVSMLEKFTHKKKVKKRKKLLDFVKAVLAAMFHAKGTEQEPYWRTEKWEDEGLVLVQRQGDGEILTWKKHPKADKGLDTKDEHWQREGKILVLKDAEGNILDWEKFVKPEEAPEELQEEHELDKAD